MPSFVPQIIASKRSFSKATSILSLLFSTFSKSFLVNGSANTEITSATPTVHASNRSSTRVTEEFVAARAASFAMSVGTG